MTLHEPEVLLQQLREGSYGASGYVTQTVRILIRNILSPTADPEPTRRIARRLEAIWPAFEQGLELRLRRTDGDKAP